MVLILEKERTVIVNGEGIIRKSINGTAFDAQNELERIEREKLDITIKEVK